MSLATAAELIQQAEEESAAVFAFNVITLEQAEAVVSGAVQARTPVLLQVSQNAIAFRGAFAPLLLACRELAEGAEVGIGLHADHVDDPALARLLIQQAARLGVGSIMFDASQLDDAANRTLTAMISREAHKVGLWVEGELGAIGGKGGAHTPGVRTDPIEAEAFVAATRVDGLAVAVGSEHAMTTQDAVLDNELISRLADAVPVPLVLHGSSGVPLAGLSQAVAAGIRKVNVGTALGVVGTRALREQLSAQPQATDVRRYLAEPRRQVAAMVSDLCLGLRAHLAATA